MRLIERLGLLLLLCCLLAFLGWEKVPCLVKEDSTDLLSKRRELEENIQRDDLNWEERILLLRQIDQIERMIHGSKMPGSSKGDGWTIEKTAKKVAKKKTKKKVAPRKAAPKRSARPTRTRRVVKKKK